MRLPTGILRPPHSLLRWPSTTVKKSTAATSVVTDHSQENSSISTTKSSKPSIVHDVAAAKEEMERCYRRLDLSFENTLEAFKSKSNWELWRQYIVFRLCGIDFLVQHNKRAIETVRRIFGKRLFELFMRGSFYGHFVAGEDQETIKPVVEKLRRFGVKSILDYSVEADVESESHEKDTTGDRREGVISARTYFYTGEPECDRNMEIFLGCIDAVAHSTDATGLAAVKLTALGRPKLLLQVSEALVQTQKFFELMTGCTGENLLTCRLSLAQLISRLREFGIKTVEKEVQDWFEVSDVDNDGYIDLYEYDRLLDHNLRLGRLFRAVNLKTSRMEPLITNLTDEEERQFGNMMHRLNTITLRAVEKNVRVMIDAEQTYFQPAINRLTIEFMKRYNKQSPVIFNTYQTYLKDALKQIRIDMHLARRDDYYFAAKLVRGAYMIQERRRAKELGYEDPVNDNFDATGAMYEKSLRAIVEEVKQRPLGKVSVMCATHNEDTVRVAVNLMREHGIGPSQRIMCFAQLYGMCDQVTMSLGQAGFSAYKYVPYGALEGVLPYLSRRALENSAVLAKAKKERRLIWNELKRRYLSGMWWYNPLKAQPVSAT